jgi:hypothetical protein
MSGFSNPLIGGGGGLVYPSIHSPDFVHGVSGWSINKDGSAEFHDIVLPSGSGGASIYFDSTEPVGAHLGDLWYDISNGMLEHQLQLVSSGASTFGTTSGAGATIAGAGGYLIGTRYQSSQAGTLEKLSMFSPAGATGEFTGAVYADSAGAPGALLVANNTPVNVNAGGFADIAMTPTAMSAGYYWLAFITSAASRGIVNGAANQAGYISGSWPYNFPSSYSPAYQAEDYIAYASLNGSPPTPTWVPFQIGTGAIADQAVTTSLIANLAVTAAQLANGTITTDQIAANAGITGAQLADLTVTVNKFKSNDHFLY